MQNTSSCETHFWSPAPGSIDLGTHNLHVWRATLDLSRPALDSLWQILSSDERARSDRFHFQRDRDRFVSARGCLRIILARYLAIDPSAIRFTYGPYGKPFVANRVAATRGLTFNLAHSACLALYAFARECEIGIDLEQIRADLAGDDIAERFFSAAEVTRLRSLPPIQQTHAFFNCWTRKEAFIKARGTGLSQPLDQFDVTLGPGEPAVLLETKWDQSEAARWSLQSIDLSSDFAAALAYEGRDRQISYWQFDEKTILNDSSAIEI